MKAFLIAICVGLAVFFLPGCGPALTQEGIHLQQIVMPPGFRISLYARVPGARSMVLSSGGILFVGTRDEGKVYAVVDPNGDQRADEVITVAEDLHTPNGVALRDGSPIAQEQESAAV